MGAEAGAGLTLQGRQQPPGPWPGSTSDHTGNLDPQAPPLPSLSFLTCQMRWAIPTSSQLEQDRRWHRALRLCTLPDGRRCAPMRQQPASQAQGSVPLGEGLLPGGLGQVAIGRRPSGALIRESVVMGTFIYLSGWRGPGLRRQ